MAITLSHGYWIALLLSLPAACFIVRLFMIQHDCGHYSFFRSRWANDLVGSLIALLTLAPHEYWREAHAIHHSAAGNLNGRGIGDVTTLTVREYARSTWWSRLGYRLYRNPLVLLLVAPTFLFVVKYRFPLDMLRGRWRLLPSILLSSLLSASAMIAAGLALGFDTVAMVQVPVTVLSATIGVWLFYVQHQFENTYWADGPVWDFHTAAFEGSSYFHLPRIAEWLTANIGAHHVHHLCSRIPSYRLPECLRRYPELRQVNRVTPWQSVKCLPLTLWDEDSQRLVTFRAARRKLTGLRCERSGGSRG
jgi:omega-6 fatty acid desaturase (delta-12 desaturase)